ncbi:hypothetical protein BV898_17509 [Hypsibius exemplaris]|uniref:Uncharacterized protein n=1 Tax=Hypsibius exemplaris TaxID=2072580 RepID=A0A9X6RM85_HYPEX|nr:hypothetical protein BV898_17509 [Hypsibius exemplaris]
MSLARRNAFSFQFATAENFKVFAKKLVRIWIITANPVTSPIRRHRLIRFSGNYKSDRETEEYTALGVTFDDY